MSGDDDPIEVEAEIEIDFSKVSTGEMLKEAESKMMHTFARVLVCIRLGDALQAAMHLGLVTAKVLSACYLITEKNNKDAELMLDEYMDAFRKDVMQCVDRTRRVKL